jgi:hypothetical protein
MKHRFIVIEYSSGTGKSLHSSKGKKLTVEVFPLDLTSTKQLLGRVYRNTCRNPDTRRLTKKSYAAYLKAYEEYLEAREKAEKLADGALKEKE